MSEGATYEAANCRYQRCTNAPQGFSEPGSSRCSCNLCEDDKPVARFLPVGQRVAGLHPDAIWTSEGFDVPLTDEFWAEGK